MSQSDARRLARLQFGSRRVKREELRDVVTIAWLESFLKDIRFSLRSLACKPSFVFTAVTALPLGIGSGTVIFSVADTVMLRPLPYDSPDRLVRIYASLRERTSEASVTPDDFKDYRAESHSFESLGASLTGTGSMTVIGIEEPIRVRATLATFPCSVRTSLSDGTLPSKMKRPRRHQLP